MSKPEIKRLFLDIETSPNTVYSWRVGRKIHLDPDNIIEERCIVCVCWKFAGSNKVNSVSWNGRGDNRKIIATILPVLNSADEIVMHNGANFDLPWIKTMALLYGVPTNPSYKVVDTCVFARKNLYLNSSKLDYLGKFLGVGAKIHTDFSLWKGVMAGDPKALKRMIEYCKQDVVLLEKVYEKLSICMPASTHTGVLSGGGKWTCPHCGGYNVVKHGRRVTAKGAVQHQMTCQSSGCFKFFTISDSVYTQYVKARHGQ